MSCAVPIECLIKIGSIIIWPKSQHPSLPKTFSKNFRVKVLFSNVSLQSQYIFIFLSTYNKRRSPDASNYGSQKIKAVPGYFSGGYRMII